MKSFGLIVMGMFALAFAPVQHSKLVHGFIIGAKPNVTEVIQAHKLESFMGKRTRVATAVKGRVIKVTKTKGGWFNIDAGGGKVIAAHFKDYRVSVPMELKGHVVIADGIVQVPLNRAAMQHFAGDSAHQKKPAPAVSRPLTLEVRGLRVE